MKQVKGFLQLLLINLITFILVSALFYKIVWAEHFGGNTTNVFMAVNMLASAIASVFFNKYRLHLPGWILFVAIILSCVLFAVAFISFLIYAFSQLTLF